MKLIIFDLDQTLVDLIPVHNRATATTFKELFGVKTRLTDIDFAGRSLTENFLELARLHNIPLEKIQQVSRSLLETYERNFAGSFPNDASRYVLPGARNLLQKLSHTENIVVLYTGNSENIVKKVLSATGLAKYFKLCVYGTQTKTRADMIQLAIEKSRALTGRKIEGKNIVVIGDSTRDVDAGRQFNALTIAVTTGFHSEAQLLEQQPDFIINNLEDHAAILKLIG